MVVQHWRELLVPFSSFVRAATSRSTAFASPCRSREKPLPHRRSLLFRKRRPWNRALYVGPLAAPRRRSATRSSRRLSALMSTAGLERLPRLLHRPRPDRPCSRPSAAVLRGPWAHRPVGPSASSHPTFWGSPSTAMPSTPSGMSRRRSPRSSTLSSAMTPRKWFLPRYLVACSIARGP